MARSLPLSRILTWLAVIAAALLVIWLLMRGRRSAAVEAAFPSDRIAAPVARSPETLAPLDQGRAAQGDVDRALYTELRERLNSEADGSVAEVESVLRGLRARVQGGEPLTVFVPFEPGPRILTGQDQFDDWAQRWFPGASLV